MIIFYAARVKCQRLTLVSMRIKISPVKPTTINRFVTCVNIFRSNISNASEASELLKRKFKLFEITYSEVFALFKLRTFGDALKPFVCSCETQ